MVLLGVNVDHVATLRQARGTSYPNPVLAAMKAIRGGADQITIHLREDRRHIQDADVFRMKNSISVPLNLEMAACNEIVSIACDILPATATLVPERRQELTTEGGLDVASNFDSIKAAVGKLSYSGIFVSLFINPDIKQIDAARKTGADAVELHTGKFCDAKDDAVASVELDVLKKAAEYASSRSMRVCAGHGMNYDNSGKIAKALPWVEEYNIGHSIIARSVFVGIENAVKEMKSIIIGIELDANGESL